MPLWHSAARETIDTVQKYNLPVISMRTWLVDHYPVLKTHFCSAVWRSAMGKLFVHTGLKLDIFVMLVHYLFTE